MEIEISVKKEGLSLKDILGRKVNMWFSLRMVPKVHESGDGWKEKFWEFVEFSETPVSTSYTQYIGILSHNVL